MKAIWLGQAGLWLELKGKTVMVDPYLSDSVGEANPRMRRRIPVDPVCLSLRPDILAFTHGHLDHYDPATVGADTAFGVQRLCASARRRMG